MVMVMGLTHVWVIAWPGRLADEAVSEIVCGCLTLPLTVVNGWQTNLCESQLGSQQVGSGGSDTSCDHMLEAHVLGCCRGGANNPLIPFHCTKKNMNQ